MSTKNTKLSIGIEPDRIEDAKKILKEHNLEENKDYIFEVSEKYRNPVIVFRTKEDVYWKAFKDFHESGLFNYTCVTIKCRVCKWRRDRECTNPYGLLKKCTIESGCIFGEKIINT